MKLRLFAACTGALFVLGLSTACQKKTDCKLNIVTVDSKGFPISNAKVKVYANVKTASGSTVEADLKAEGVSDGSGTSTYTFKLPAILDIRATTTGTGTTAPLGTGIIKLEEGKTVEKTIIIK